MGCGRPKGFGAPTLRFLAVGGAFALIAATAGPAVGEPRFPDDPLAHPAGLTRSPWDAESRGWLSVGVLAGTTQFDNRLADHQWDTTPSAGWGFRLLAGRGPFAAGVCLWRAGTSQSLGDLGDPLAVRATRWELVGEARVAEPLGIEVIATAAAGRQRIGYEPDRIDIRPAGAGEPITVRLAPVGAWIGGGGLALRRPLAAGWAAGLGLDVRRFAMDTAHRAGDAVVLARESFGDWSAHVELARRWTR